MKKRPAPLPQEPSLHSLLFQANRQAVADLRRVVGAVGVPIEFWRVLEVLADERGRTLSALAGEAGMQLSAASKVIDRMVDAALVQRSADPRDHRRVVLHVSDFGLAKVAALRGDIGRQQLRLERDMSGERVRALRVLLQELIRAQRRAAG